MQYGLYVSAAGAEVQNRRLQAIAHNLANVDTTAFKRQLAVVQARANAAVERGRAQVGSNKLSDVSGGVELVTTLTDFSRGTLRRTGIPSDLALPAPDMFFVVERDGANLLTRAGNFTFTADGMLVDGHNNPVLGDGGPIRIDPALPWNFTPDGSIEQAGAPVARLRLVSPRSLADLVRVGDNLYRPLAPVDMVDDAQRRVLVEHLEMSGVQPAAELMEMIEASRAFETNARLLQHQDQLTGTLINRLLRGTV